MMRIPSISILVPYTDSNRRISRVAFRLHIFSNIHEGRKTNSNVFHSVILFLRSPDTSSKVVHYFCIIDETPFLF